jgi:hypothetical protein
MVATYCIDFYTYFTRAASDFKGHALSMMLSPPVIAALCFDSQCGRSAFSAITMQDKEASNEN